MIHPIILILSVIFLLTSCPSARCFTPSGLSGRIAKESSLGYNTKPYDEKDGVITVIPNLPSVPDRIKNIYSVTTLDDYERVLKEQKDKLIVTRFYMTNCKACVAMTPSFYRLVRSKPSVVFVDIPISKENKDIHLRLGVETVPFSHINHPIFGLVEERKISRKHWDEFESVVQSYVDGECVITRDDFTNPFDYQLDFDPNYF